MIGELKIHVTLLDSIGDRCDATIRAQGPGESDYTFPLSITRTVQAIWGIDDKELETQICSLAYGIMEIQGTSNTPPVDGYWFDSYNSESTIHDTINKIRNLGIASFLRNRTVGDEIAKIFGGNILPALEALNSSCVSDTGMRFVESLDAAFEASEATEDLSSPPATKADFLYRICILSVIIDRFGLRKANESRSTKSLQALRNWIEANADADVAQRLTEAFARVKDLRKQYPIHEHYVVDSEGQKAARDEVRSAEAFFAFADHHDYPAKWKLVTDSFTNSLEDIKQIIESAGTDQEESSGQ